MGGRFELNVGVWQTPRIMAHPVFEPIDLPWLRSATAKIGQDYFAVAAHGRLTPRARERVYAYELYHQLRQQIGEVEHSRLMGEIDKRGQATISANVAPDLIWHVPGEMGGNDLVIEVKPAGAKTAGIRKDLGTLTFFRREAHYHRAVLLVYGEERHIPRFRGIAANDRFDRYGRPIDATLLELWWHSSPGIEARFVPWSA
jgi:hypothetical protein